MTAEGMDMVLVGGWDSSIRECCSFLRKPSFLMLTSRLGMVSLTMTRTIVSPVCISIITE